MRHDLVTLQLKVCNHYYYYKVCKGRLTNKGVYSAGLVYSLASSQLLFQGKVTSSVDIVPVSKKDVSNISINSSGPPGSLLGHQKVIKQRRGRKGKQ